MKLTYQEILVNTVNKKLSIASVISILCPDRKIHWDKTGSSGIMENVFPYDEKSGFTQEEWRRLQIIVNKTYNTAICHECGLGGLPIRFTRDYTLCTDQEAGERLLPQLQTTKEELKEISDKNSDVAIKWRIRRGDIFEAVHQVLMREYWRNKAAKSFAEKRGWNTAISRAYELGYCDEGTILKAARDNEWGLDDLAECGFLIRTDHADGTADYTERYKYRISYPIRNAEGRLVAFSFRDAGKNEEDWIRRHPEGPKFGKKCLYMPSESCIEPSSEQLYGIHIAKRHITTTNPNIYIVEGQPDAMAMWAAGYPNTVAVMTSYMSEEIVSEKYTHDEYGQRDGIKTEIITEGKFKGLLDIGVKKITFVPDIDKYDDLQEPWGAGIKACLTNIERAKKVTYTNFNDKANLEVDVIELPVTINVEHAVKPSQCKQDADSFLAQWSTPEEKHDNFAKLKPVDFAQWWGAKVAQAISDKGPEEKAKWAKRAVTMLANIQSNTIRNMVLDSIVKACKGLQKNLLVSMLKSEQGQRRQEALKKEQSFKGDLGVYGFYEKPDELSGGHVYAMQDKDEPFTDFIIEPHYCIKDLTNKTVWVCEFICENGHREVMTIDNDDITSAPRFKSLSAKAAMSFEGKEPELNRIFRYIKNNSQNIIRISRMGWQTTHDIWVWGNGVFENGNFIPANKFGVCDISKDRHIYIPAARELGDMDEDGDQFQFEHDFSYQDDTAGGFNKINKPSLKTVFGAAHYLWEENGVILLEWLVGSIFYDIVVQYGSNFPIFVGYGPKGSGKSASAKFMTSFFSKTDCMRQTLSSTKAALDSTVKHTSCAVTHWDEYSEAVGRDPEKVDMIKGAWDGYTRAKMNAKTDFSTSISTKVKSGVIITGQVFPNSDSSMLRRYVLCEYYDEKEKFNSETNKAVFDTMADWEKASFQHLTHQLLGYRETMNREYQDYYQKTSEQVQFDLSRVPNIVPSIRDNYVAILSVMRTLSREDWWPFSYDDAYNITLKRIIWQSNLSESKDERAAFWMTLQRAVNRYDVINGVHYKIKYVDKLSSKEKGKDQIKKICTKVLLLRFDDVYPILKAYARNDDELSKKLMDATSMWHYIEKQGCICKVREETFYNVDQNNRLLKESDGSAVKATRQGCYAFDYEKLQREYPDLTLEDAPKVAEIKDDLEDMREAETNRATEPLEEPKLPF